ncbi:MAG: hypothetical protein MUC49_15815 [Raineya sp.]|jgi:hypothetical protein|nr:hypothetical protein [Raineya sp.]
MFFTPAQIERGIFEAIRLKAVAMGLWPDETTMTTAEELKTALDAINTPIEIIGIGDYRARGEKPLNCLLVDFDSGNSAEVGAIGGVRYELQTSGNTYKKIGLPTQSENLNFQIRVIAENTAGRRLAELILRASLRRKTYLKGVKDNGSYTDNGFWVFGGNFIDISKNEYGIERMFTYTVSNVFLEPTEDLGEVAATQEITIDTEINLN